MRDVSVYVWRDGEHSEVVTLFAHGLPELSGAHYRRARPQPDHVPVPDMSRDDNDPTRRPGVLPAQLHRQPATGPDGETAPWYNPQMLGPPTAGAYVLWDLRYRVLCRLYGRIAQRARRQRPHRHSVLDRHQEDVWDPPLQGQPLHEEPEQRVR